MPETKPTFEFLQKVRLKPVGFWKWLFMGQDSAQFIGRVGDVVMVRRGEYSGRNLYTIVFLTSDGKTMSACFFEDELESVPIVSTKQGGAKCAS